MKTVVLYNIISFIILVALIFVLRIVSKSNLRQNQQLVIKVIATILIVCVIAFVLFIDAIAFDSSRCQSICNTVAIGWIRNRCNL